MMDNMILLKIIEEKERKNKKLVLLLIIKINKKYYDIGRINVFYWIKCYGINRKDRNYWYK